MTNKRLMTLLLSGIALVFSACGNRNSTEGVQTTATSQMNSQASDEQEVLEILNEISVASVNKDVETLNKILPDNYVLIHMTGYRQTKDEWIDEVANGSMEYFSGNGNNTTQQIVSIDGDTATVSNKGTVEAKIGTGAVRRTWHISSTATFKKIDGQWIIQETDATK